jgi:hypothetical protein
MDFRMRVAYGAAVEGVRHLGCGDCATSLNFIKKLGVLFHPRVKCRRRDVKKTHDLRVVQAQQSEPVGLCRELLLIGARPADFAVQLGPCPPLAFPLGLAALLPGREAAESLVAVRAALFLARLLARRWRCYYARRLRHEAGRIRIALGVLRDF